jgi:hypothetical protein
MGWCFLQFKPADLDAGRRGRYDRFVPSNFDEMKRKRCVAGIRCGFK